MQGLLFRIEENGLIYTFCAHPFSLDFLWLEVWRGTHLCFRKLHAIINLERIEWENDYYGDLSKHFPKHIQAKADQLIVRIFKLKAFL